MKFLNIEQINLTLQTDLIWNFKYKKIKLYNKACWIQKCFQCHKYDHINAQCDGQQKCSNYVEKYKSENCLFKNLKKQKYTSCKNLHRICDDKCFNYQKEMTQIQMACSIKWIYWRILNFRVHIHFLIFILTLNLLQLNIVLDNFHFVQSKISSQNWIST